MNDKYRPDSANWCYGANKSSAFVGPKEAFFAVVTKRMFSAVCLTSHILTFAYHLTSLTNRRFVGDVSSNGRSTNILLGLQMTSPTNRRFVGDVICKPNKMLIKKYVFVARQTEGLLRFVSNLLCLTLLCNVWQRFDAWLTNRRFVRYAIFPNRFVKL